MSLRAGEAIGASPQISSSTPSPEVSTAAEPVPDGRSVGVAHALGPVEEIPVGEGRAYAVDGLQIAVFRLRSGALRAISAVCPHLGGPLADGQADDAVVICPLHAHVFELATGACRTGQPPVASYRVSVDDAGQVVLEVPPPDA